MNLLDFLVQGAIPVAAERQLAGRQERERGLLAEAERQQQALARKRAEELDRARIDEIRKRTALMGKPSGSAAFPYTAVGGKSILHRGTGEVTPIADGTMPDAGDVPVVGIPQRGTPEYLEYERRLARARAQGASEGRPQASGDRVAASTRTQMAEGAAQLDLIRQAREAIRRRPESVGLQRGIGLIPGMGQIGEQVNQRTDPEGNAVRQLIGQVSAMKIKDLSGAAVTVSEFPRLAAFVPLVWDTPEKIQANLDQLERELLVVQRALAEGVSLADLMGNAPPSRGVVPRPASPSGAPSAPPDFEAWRQSRRGNP